MSTNQNPFPEHLKGKCARKSTHSKPREKTPESDESTENRPLDTSAALRIQRLLEFNNPGRLNSSLATPSKRRRRNAFERAKRLTTQAVNNVTVSKDNFPIVKNCDCIRLNCKGCFPKCKKCNSRKCGRYCQINRGWIVVEAVIPGSSAKPLKNNAIDEVDFVSDVATSDGTVSEDA